MKRRGEVFDLENLLQNIEEDSYWIDFIKIRHLEAGILRLYANQEDTQTQHDSDELYFVIEGSGFMEIDSESVPVKKGSVVFVPANTTHHLYGNKDTFVVLYVFAE